MHQLYPLLQVKRKTGFYKPAIVQQDRSFASPSENPITEQNQTKWGTLALMTYLPLWIHYDNARRTTTRCHKFQLHWEGRGTAWGGVSASWWNGLIIYVKCLGYQATGQTWQQSCTTNSFHVIMSSKRLSRQLHYTGYTVLIQADSKSAHK